MEFKISDSEKVEDYIRGKLKQSEIEALWIRFLEAPELFKYFETEIHIRKLIRDVKNGKETSPFKNDKN